MSSTIRSQASAKLLQSFSATCPKVTPTAIGLRKLSISEPRDASSVMNSFETTVASIPKRSDITPSGRSYNTSRTMKQVNDSSTVDFAYIPAFSFAGLANSEYSRIPLMPDNHVVKHQDTAPEPHIVKAEISTATYTDVVASMSEVDASKAADAIGLNTVSGKDNTIKRVWNDFLDDVMGVKKATLA